MKRLVLVVTVIVFGLAVYGCSSKCVAKQPLGGYPYDQEIRKGGVEE
ncbi:MAG: hypothetical protein A4E57_01485 [Syntrophorhabdaceae bacterium PtaU1.Bin034]|jgi:hypothetical protein|nr:MAG: hypothetical protein A4E57_01485 [Syntrophorhabdaceae bacterium PtaU1.Bin034]